LIRFLDGRVVGDSRQNAADAGAQLAAMTAADKPAFAEAEATV